MEVKVLDPAKRPLAAFVDGVDLAADVRSLRVRVSRVAGVELAFLSGPDLAEKIAALQFPDDP